MSIWKERSERKRIKARKQWRTKVVSFLTRNYLEWIVETSNLHSSASHLSVDELRSMILLNYDVCFEAIRIKVNDILNMTKHL